jgi:hypothetical protein
MGGRKKWCKANKESDIERDVSKIKFHLLKWFILGHKPCFGILPHKADPPNTAKDEHRHEMTSCLAYKAALTLSIHFTQPRGTWYHAHPEPDSNSPWFFH